MKLLLYVGLSLLLQAGAPAPAGDLKQVTDAVRAGLDALEGARWEQAEASFGQALAGWNELESSERSENELYGALALHGLAQVDQTLGRPERALEHLREARHGAERLTPDIASLLESRRAMVLVTMGLPDLAVEPIGRARELSDEDLVDGDVNFGARFNAFYAEALQRLAIARWEDVLETLEEMERAIDWEAAEEKIGARRLSKNLASMDVLRGTALANIAQADPTAAGRARAALEAVAANGDANGLERFTAVTRLAYLDLDEGAVEAAKARLEEVRTAAGAQQYGQLPNTEWAWLAALEARRERLAEGLTERTLGRLEEAFEGLLAEWRTVERPGGTGFLRFRRARLLLTELVGAAGPERGLDVVLRSQTMGVLWRALGEPSPSTAEVREELCAGATGCLVFVAGPDRSFLFVVDREEIERHELPSYAWIEERQDVYRRWLRRAPDELSEERRKVRAEQLAATAGELAEALLPRAVRERLAGWRHVRVVGRGSLAGLPYETLPVFDGRPFGVSHALSELPSLPVGYALSKQTGRATRSAGRVCLVAAPRVGRELAEQFGLARDDLTAESVAPLRAALAGNDPLLRLEERATVSAVGQARAAGCTLLHVLAHGVVDPERELRPMIALAPDETWPEGLLTVRNARELVFPEVVFLSVCRSADGIDRPGDAGAAHLGGAVLQGGASCVILTGEDLRLSAALAMTTAFHAALDVTPDEALTVAEALRRARESLWKDPRFSDPATWGFLHAYGLGEALR